ncbi:hypothetical protein BGW39_005819, partial [Mortierella sp. 14UC]
VFHGKCHQEHHNGYWNMMLKITFNEGPHDASTDSASPSKSMVLPLGDTTAKFRGFYLPEPSKLVIFAEGYMKIWTLSSTATHICQLDYIWGTLSYEPNHAADYCHRPLVEAWACPHGTSMCFRLGKRVWYKNHVAVDGTPDSDDHDILTVPPHQEGETVDTKETERLQYGIFSLIDIYGFGDPNCKDDIVRYLLTCIRPSNTSKTSCLIPLCNAWSIMNQEYLTDLVRDILPKGRITWIPDSKATKMTDPLAILLKIASNQQSVLGLVKVIMGYCIAQATQHRNMAFLFPIFASMDKIMEHYPEEALKCMGRIAYIPVKYPAYIWKNNIACRKMAPLRFPVIEKIRRIVMSEAAKKRMKQLNPIMQFNYKTDKTVQDVEDNVEKPVFMASFDALWSYTGRYGKKKDADDKNENKDDNDKSKANEDGGKGRRDKGGRKFAGIRMGRRKRGKIEADTTSGEAAAKKRSEQLTPHNSFARSDIFGEPLVVEKTTWWKVLFHMFRSKLLFHVRPVVICYDFDLEFFDNPAIDALVTYKWDTIGFPYWFVRFFCQFFYYVLVVTAALTQVYNPQPSDLFGVFIAIIAMGIMFIALEIMQLVQDWRRYLMSHYNFVDIVTFVIPPIASGTQIYFIDKQDIFASNRLLSFSVLVVFLHMLLELRVSRGVCKYVTIIQQAVVEIWVFFGIFAGCIVSFTITLLHLRRSCVYEGCMRDPTNYPRNFVSALSATYFFLGGRYDPVALELSADVNEDWAFHMAMFIFLFSTTILMLNVLIALINVAFGKGDDGWRKAWIEARLRYIESAENLSYHIPGFRQTYDWFPKQIYFTASAKEVNRYIDKYPRGRRQDDINALVDDWIKSEGDHEDKDKDKGNDRRMDKSKEKVMEERKPLASKPSIPRLDPPLSNSQETGDPADLGLPSPYGGTFQTPKRQKKKRVPIESIFSGASSGDGVAGATEGMGGEEKSEESGAGETQRFGSTSSDSEADNSVTQQRSSVSSRSRQSKLGEPVAKRTKGETSSGAIDMGDMMTILRRLDAQMNKMDGVIRRVTLIEEQIEGLTALLQPAPRLSLSDNSALLDSTS